MRQRVAAALLLPLLAAAGCGDRGNVDFGGRDVGADLYSVEGSDGTVRMALTTRYVYLAISDQTRDQVRGELSSAAEEEGGRGLIAGFMERAVGKAMQFRALYPVDEIEDIRWEDGDLYVEFVRGSKHRDGVLRMGDDPVDGAFDEQAVTGFSQAFHALKRERAALDR
jgi:hypothetical protein